MEQSGALGVGNYKKVELHANVIDYQIIEFGGVWRSRLVQIGHWGIQGSHLYLVRADCL